MSQQSWKARKMQPGHDTISTMAMHYGLKPKQVGNIIKTAGVDVIRQDGFRGKLVMIRDVDMDGKRMSPVLGWSDGEPAVDFETTRLTKAAISAVAHWKIASSEDSAA